MSIGCESSSLTDYHLCPVIGQKGNNAANQTNINNTTANSKSKSTSTVNPIYNNDNSDHKLPMGSNDQTPTSSSSSAVAHQEYPITKEMRSALDTTEHQPKSMGLALGFTLPICMLLMVSLWVLYAYRNPHTKSGQLLIQVCSKL